MRFLTVVGAVAVGLLLAELSLRVVGFRYLNLYQEDQYLGFSLRPGAQGWWTREGRAYVKINGDGLRDREHSKSKPPGTLRIAVLGDSYAEALQVEAADAFWAVAEQRLQGCGAFGGKRAEVINFGVSGFSTARELITLRRRVWQYSPDVVVLVVTTGNDVRDNSRLLSREYAGDPLPYFVYQDGKLVLDDSLLRARNESWKSRLRGSILGRSLDWMRSHLRLVGLFDEARASFRNYGVRRNPAPGGGDEPGLDDEVYLEPADPAWAEAWRVTEGLLRLTADEVRAGGARFLLVTGSSGIQVHPDPSVRQSFARSLGADDLFYPNRRIKEWGEREGVEVLTLAPGLREYAEQQRVFLHGTDGRGHWNVLGHRAVGERLAEKLCGLTAAR